MYGIRALPSVAWVPVLSACMMMGGVSGHGVNDHLNRPLQYAAASDADLAIALSFPAPSHGGTVPIEAQLRLQSDQPALTDASVWLRVRTPGGSVDEIRMQRAQSSVTAAYHAQYTFPTSGYYIVTAEGRMGEGTGARLVSVSIEADVGAPAPGADRHWLVPAAVVGGLSMALMMVLMLN